MAEYIPFVTGKDDCQRLKLFHPEAKLVRVSLESVAKFSADLPKGVKVWMDPGVDAYDHYLGKSMTDWPDYLSAVPEHDRLADEGFLDAPDSGKIRAFVTGILNHCCQYKPSWLSTPQLPLVKGSERNKVNRALARATDEWRISQGYAGKLVLPVIFTNQCQYTLKAKRNEKLKAALKCAALSHADMIWVVDASLNDQEGTGTHGKRFDSLIQFHEALAEKAQSVIAGPYWALNLVLWAKQLCRPAIGVGGAYRYYVPGGFMRRGATRLVVPPIRRQVKVHPELRKWLAAAMAALASSDPCHKELQKIDNAFDTLSRDVKAARRRAAKFYKNWLADLTSVPSSGRKLALYQTFSSAYVLGKQLPTLPRNVAKPSNPERVAEQFMLHCL